MCSTGCYAAMYLFILYSDQDNIRDLCEEPAKHDNKIQMTYLKYAFLFISEYFIVTKEHRELHSYGLFSDSFDARCPAVVLTGAKSEENLQLCML